MPGRTGATHIRNYFGKLPGQSLHDLVEEFKDLTDEDWQQLVDGITNGSLTY